MFAAVSLLIPALFLHANCQYQQHTCNDTAIRQQEFTWALDPLPVPKGFIALVMGEFFKALNVVHMLPDIFHSQNIPTKICNLLNDKTTFFILAHLSLAAYIILGLKKIPFNF